MVRVVAAPTASSSLSYAAQKRQPHVPRVHRARRRRDAARLPVGERRAPRRRDRHAAVLSTSASRSRSTTGKGLIVPVIRNAQDLQPRSGSARAICDLAAARAHEEAAARRRAGRHVHDHEPRRLRDVPRHADHQPAAVGHPRHVRARQARRGSSRTSSAADVIAIRPLMNLTAHVRPPPRRRRVRRHVPARHPRPALELGRGGGVLGRSDASAAVSCGGVRFEVTEPFRRARRACHCEFCKRIAGGYGTVTAAAWPTPKAIQYRRGVGAPAFVHPRGRPGEDVLLRSAGRTSSAAAGPESESSSVQVCAAFGLDYDRKPEAHTFVRSVGRVGDPPRRRPAAVRRHVRPRVHGSADRPDDRVRGSLPRRSTG